MAHKINNKKQGKKPEIIGFLQYGVSDEMEQKGVKKTFDQEDIANVFDFGDKYPTQNEIHDRAQECAKKLKASKYKDDVILIDGESFMIPALLYYFMVEGLTACLPYFRNNKYKGYIRA